MTPTAPVEEAGASAHEPEPQEPSITDSISRLHSKYKQGKAQCSPSCLGCLGGLLFFPLGIVYLIRLDSKEKRLKKSIEEEIKNLSRSIGTSTSELFDHALTLSSVANDKDFLSLIDKHCQEQQEAEKAAAEKEKIHGTYLPTTNGFQCAYCGNSIEVRQAGTTVSCSCGEHLAVPLNPPCPKCGGNNTVFKTHWGKRGAASLVGELVGAALLGPFGAIIGSGAGQGLAAFHCLKCGYKWGLRLTRPPPVPGRKGT